MGVTGWPSARPPAGFDKVWHQEPTRLADLPGVRSRIRTFMAATSGPVSLSADWIELFVLVIDEITSNALRHGATPIHLCLGTDRTSWLVTVTDRAPGAPPVPAVGRAPGAGGYGLYMIADLTSDHGWHSQDHHKTVWALLSVSRDENRTTAR
ncbi:ATP-binding protein [Blastococcus saxobsidens]|uniref:Anti-sigma regulatory factor (Ser/Thr protein kinase) n=1 Tax=Blastococcus saxobsidens (strain DD2) TaxID=1146883 RepID=H6RU77_BLASD|nr:ATP-binding protein [Blastococcus saxobsidens]CCG05684.1 Anti-sigma regulatory factor (Ser/Thr protein kinase) [Blastococcus saxobsidens DD2]